MSRTKFQIELFDGDLSFTDTDRVTHIGFTGSREGMTEQQIGMTDIFASFFTNLFDVTFHHGDCIGADETAAAIFGYHSAFTEGHPGHIPDYWAHFPSDITHVPDNTLERNKVIAKLSDFMLAAPKESEQQYRGGTWTTIRYANQLQTPGFVMLPDGTMLKFSDFK